MTYSGETIALVTVLIFIQWCLCFQGNRYEQEKLLKQSNTLYVGNLSFYTTEEQVGHIITKSIIGYICKLL